MRKNNTKRRIADGVPSVGVGLLWPSPELVELLGGLGFQWLWLDVEHGAFDLPSLAHTIRAAESVGMDAIIRLPKVESASSVLPYVELNPAGVIVAHTRSAADVQAAVDAVKFPPVGHRSAGGLRGARWGAVPGFQTRANDELMVMALVEDTEGIGNMDDILSVAELDAVVIGFGDLSLEMGHPGQKNHPEVLDVGTPAQNKVLESSKALQVTAQDGEEAASWIARGALMVRCTAHTVLAQGARRWLEAAQNKRS